VNDSEKETGKALVGDVSVTTVSRSVAQVFDDCVTLQDAPLLLHLVNGSNGEALRAELMRLIERFLPNRAPREKMRVIGKLIRVVGGEELEEPVVIRDISESGAMLAISTSLGISASELARVKLRLKIPGLGDALVNARLVRVIQADERFIQAGFRFEELPPPTAQALHTVQHTHTMRASQIAQARISQYAPGVSGAQGMNAEKEHEPLGPSLK